MGICDEDRGQKLWITYECVGKGKEDVWTYELAELRESLQKAMKKMGIIMKEINQVTYSFTDLNINNTVQELGIPNGGVVTIKLKSTF
jgi:hypothetical protein